MAHSVEPRKKACKKPAGVSMVDNLADKAANKRALIPMACRTGTGPWQRNKDLVKGPSRTLLERAEMGFA